MIKFLMRYSCNQEGQYSLGELAALYSVTRQAMHELLKRRIKLRPQQRYGSDNHFHRGTKAIDSAQNKAEKAIASGEIKRLPCETCGASPAARDGRSLVQAHHDDYSKPLAVRWLCQKHHHEWHKLNVAKGAN